MLEFDLNRMSREAEKNALLAEQINAEASGNTMVVGSIIVWFIVNVIYGACSESRYFCHLCETERIVLRNDIFCQNFNSVC